MFGRWLLAEHRRRLYVTSVQLNFLLKEINPTLYPKMGFGQFL
jgi:hypothetical protein